MLEFLVFQTTENVTTTTVTVTEIVEKTVTIDPSIIPVAAQAFLWVFIGCLAVYYVAKAIYKYIT